MYYLITHLTRFNYTEPITDSYMEVRKQPRTDSHQRCIQFEITLSPKAKTLSHKDYMGNVIHVFDIPGRHKRLGIKMDATVEVKSPTPLQTKLTDSHWQVLDQAVHEDRDLFDMIMPSQYSRTSPLLRQFSEEINVGRYTDPLTTILDLNTQIYEAFAYIQNETAADSPIEVALDKRAGVCQDFAHIMSALLRDLGIPTRYISGYLHHRTDYDRSAADATHAWVEAWLPEIGWIGLDPTNNLICNEQHIRVAIGRDYADVPPTKGTFRGDATSDLEVEVKVTVLDELPIDEEDHAPEIHMPHYELMTQQQQQQQQ